MNQLIVDIGNSRIKTVQFKDNKFGAINYFINNIEFLNSIEKNNLKHLSTIVSSVRTKEETEEATRIFSKSILLNFDTSIPIENKYSTPKTLGNDRLANVVYANNLKANENNLVIDVGTCLKFDFINNQNQYIGGSISLGFSMRYKAIHNFTDNLPLFNNESTNKLTGTDTKSSIVSGVYLGMLAEIKQFITEYEKSYDKVNIFLTGGDLSYFKNEELSQKNSIFVDPLLTLKGLKVILDFNEQNK